MSSFENLKISNFSPQNLALKISNFSYKVANFSHLAIVTFPFSPIQLSPSGILPTKFLACLSSLHNPHPSLRIYTVPRVIHSLSLTPLFSTFASYPYHQAASSILCHHLLLVAIYFPLRCNLRWHLVSQNSCKLLPQTLTEKIP